MTDWFRILLAELPWVRDLPEASGRPLPRVAVELRRSVPGWLLRVAATLANTALLVVAAQRVALPQGLAWTLAAMALVAMAVWPHVTVALITIVLSGLLIAFDGHGPFDPVVLALAPLAYAAVRLAWWAERVGLDARIELGALRRGLWQGVLLVAGTVGFGALVWLIAGHPSAVTVIAGGAGLVLLAWLVFVRKD